MRLDTLWTTYHARGYAAASEALPANTLPSDALDHFYLALLAFGHDDLAPAAAHAHQAAERMPKSRVYQQAAIYLDRVVTQGQGRRVRRWESVRGVYSRWG